MMLRTEAMLTAQLPSQFVMWLNEGMDALVLRLLTARFSIRQLVRHVGSS